MVTTADKPRDSFVNFIAYLPRWTVYSLNISSIHQFINEGNYEVALKMTVGSLYWWSCFLSVFMLDSRFALAYMLYPLGENILLLAAVNWCWHAFEDPNPHLAHDDYVGSITILEGPINVLNENYHVVHHQYPSAHWSTYPDKLRKHWAEYGKHQASVFTATHAFELFGFIVSKDYEALAERYVDLKGQQQGEVPLTKEQKVTLMKERLRCCTWGPRAKLLSEAPTEASTEASTST